MFGQPVYDVGIGSPVFLVRTALKPDGTPFYHLVREHNQDVAYDGRLYYYFADTDKIAASNENFLSIFDVENYLLALYPRSAVDAALDKAYSDEDLEAEFIELVKAEDVQGLKTLVDQEAGVEGDEPRGLPNRRFDCFLNAILQIMAGPYLNIFDPAVQQPESVKAQEVQAAVWALLQKINNTDKSAFTRKDVYNLRQLLLRNNIVLSAGEQEDASELMIKLLQAVLPPDQSVGLRIERSIKEENTKPIEKTSLGSDPTQYAGGKRSHAEATNMIEVEMDRYNSLQAFLYEQFGKGVATKFDAKNRPKAESDGKAVEISQVTERRAFTRLPGVVTFYLKRFRERPTGGRERLGKRFDMPRNLFLIDESTETKSYVEFELAGVVVQSGSLSGGHYISHVKRGQAWQKFDDDKPVQEDKVGEDIGQGYIYTYRKVGALTKLPEGAQAPQETEPKPGEIQLDTELSRFSGLLGREPSTSRPGTESDRIQGLPNRADDCFLNAVLQLMAGPYAEFFDPERNKLQRRAAAGLQKLLWALMQRINKQDKGDIKADEIGKIRKAMVGMKLIDANLGQEDAIEVVRRLLELVLPARELAQVETERSFEESDAQPTERKNLPKTDPARYGRDRKSTGAPVNTSLIEVEMGDFQSLEGFLYHYYGRGNTVEYDKANEPKVLHEEQPVSLSRVRERRAFKQLPGLLSFVLHRFRIDKDGNRVRIDRKFAMPDNLLLLEEAGEAPERVEYELVAVVVQQGGLEGGHYYTHRKDEEEGDWLRADDRNVTESGSLGRDRSEGYLYTYRRKAKASKSLLVAQEEKLFARDDLGRRLVVLMKTKKFDEAKELLSFPSVDVNTRTQKGETALYLAVLQDQVELVQRLLARGADPSLAGPDGIPSDLALAIKADSRILTALQLYSSSDLGKRLASFSGTDPSEELPESLDPKAILRNYEEISALERLLNNQTQQVGDPTTASPEGMALLAQGLQRVQGQRQALNNRIATFYGIKRAGAGGRPDAAKALTLPTLTTDDRRFLLTFIGSTKSEEEERSSEQILQSEGKGEREKIVQEAFTALFALKRKTFKKVEPGGKTVFKGYDIDLKADDTPWDQKAIVYGKGMDHFEGRLKETHHKYNKKQVGETFDATRPPGVESGDEEYPKVGLLLDSTYVLSQQYETAWQTILEYVLRGEVNPKYIRETKAPDDVTMVSEKFFDSRAKDKPDWAPSVLTAELLAQPGAPLPTIPSNSLPNALQERLLAIIRKEFQPYSQYTNVRGWLPGGAIYFEYPVPGDDAKNLGGNHCKLVVPHDYQHLYLTCSHYAGFSYLDGSGTLVVRPPFYDILPQGDLAKAMGISVEDSGSETLNEEAETRPLSKRAAKKQQKQKKAPGRTTTS